MRLPVADFRTMARKSWELVCAHKREFTAVMALQLAVVAVGLVIPFVVGRAIDDVTAGTTRGHIYAMIGIIAVAVLAQVMLAFFGDRAAIRFAERVLAELRNRVVSAITHLPLGMVERVGSGDMIGRTTNDVDRVQYFVQMAMSRLVYIVLMLIVTFVTIIVQAPVLGVLVVASVFPVFGAIRWYLSRTHAGYLAVSAIRAGLAGVVSETIEQNGTADAMRLGPSRASRADVVIKEMWSNELYTGWARAQYILFQQVLVTFPVLVAVLGGAWFIESGMVSLGAVTAVALYAMQLREPLWNLGWWMDEGQFSAVALSRIMGVELAEGDSRTDGEDAGSHARLGERGIPASSDTREGQIPKGYDLAIDNVRFSYDDGADVLHGLTMRVRAGETIAVVGPSGAGKSTLGRLIAGVNPPNSGAVTIGGAEVTRIAEGQLHSTVAMLTQEHHVFVGTIAENLNLAKRDATDAEMIAALADVGARAWFDELDEGLETRVGSGGVVLTPPQAQQLALARIILLDPGVLVLDEATSLLDPNAARSLEQTLARVLEGRTVISIAHRLYTAHDADRVAVVMDGTLAEFGTHDELVALGGEYAGLWETWQRD